MSIALHSNSRQHANLAKELEAALGGSALTDDAAFGRDVEAFERMLGQYCGARFAVAVASGSDALTIALTALDLPAGSEVITCGFGFYATAASIIRAGLTPVVVDTAGDGYLIDADAVQAAITDRTSAIMPVHMFGETAEIRRLSQIAVDHELALVEDCAQAIGARFGDHVAGTFGDSAAISFNWSKHLSCTSNGGAVITNDEHQVERLRALRSYGSTGGFWHQYPGLNSRLNPFEARVLSVKLPHLGGWVDRRRAIAARYRSNLAGVDVTLPPMPPPEHHVYHKFTIAHPDRDGLRAYLKERGIGSMACYPHLLGEHPAFGGKVQTTDLTRAARRAATALSIPIWPELTDSEIDEISWHIADFCGAS